MTVEDDHKKHLKTLVRKACETIDKDYYNMLEFDSDDSDEEIIVAEDKNNEEEDSLHQYYVILHKPKLEDVTFNTNLQDIYIEYDVKM